MNSNKISITLLSLAIVFSGITTVYGNNTITEIIDTHKFSDVQSTDIEVLYLHEIGIIKGNPDGTIKSNDPLNRAETLTMLSRFFHIEPQYDPNCSFSDIQGNEWYAPYVSALCSRGLVEGYPDGTFKGSDTLNRAEALALLVRGLNATPNPPYNMLPSDVPSEAWFAPYAQFANQHNLFEGVRSGFNGARNYTRGDMFEIMYRYSRINELNETEYSISLDPSVISVVAGKSSDVSFRVTGGSNNYSSYFNNLKSRTSNEISVNLPKSYKQAAVELEQYWYVNMKGQLDAGFVANSIEPIRRITFLPQVDFTNSVKEFYRHFGLNIDNKNIDENITSNELTTVVNGIRSQTREYNREIGQLRISFLVKDDQKIEILFDGYQQGQYGYVTGWDPNYENTLDAGEGQFEAELIKIKEIGTNQEITNNKIYFDSAYQHAILPNGDKKLIGYESKLIINLGESLEAGRRYSIELEPLIFTKFVKGKGNNGEYFLSDSITTNVYLPETTFEFVPNSAKEFTFTGNGNTRLAGIAIDTDIRVAMNRVPLTAIPYSEDGRVMDADAGELEWSIIEGNGSIQVDSKGMPWLNVDNLNTDVTVQVRYKGFESQKTIHFVVGDNI